MDAFIRLLCLLCAALCLTACAPLLAVMGSGHTVVTVVAQAERIKLLGDGVSYAASSKTITDHALSAAVGADCKLFNVVTREPVCAAKTAHTAADAKVRLSLGPAADPYPQPAAQATMEIDTENIAPPAERSEGDERE
jgi:hypothetical protein